MEARTLWDPEVGELSGDERMRLSEKVHRKPEEAARIWYERSHTGFTREITVTEADDPPTLDPLASPLIMGDAPSFSITLTGISDGGAGIEPLTVSATADGSKAGKCVAGRVKQVNFPTSTAGRQTYTRTVKIP